MNSKDVVEKKWIWTDEYLISSYDVDAKGKASQTTLSKLMQETAYNHAYHLEFGYHQLKEKKLFIEWILDSFPEDMHREFAVTEFEINFLSEAKMGDEAAIHTEKLEDASHAFRHCIKRKSDNRDICPARTGWEKK